MKEILNKISTVCKWIFGYGIMLTLFIGGLTFFGYLIALFIGGDIATSICTFINNQVNPVMTYLSTSMVLLGLLAMYLAGEKALVSEKKKNLKKK